MSRKAIIISASSDIGAALCKQWAKAGWNILGTYRTLSPSVQDLKQLPGVIMKECDLLDTSSIVHIKKQVQERIGEWNVLIFAPGILAPVGVFEDVSFEEWEKGIHTNFLSPMRILHALLPMRKKEEKPPTVLFFAGAGTNGPAPCYSSYAVSKIGLIKMCELLDAEIPDTRFVILGPGWVKTKIHQDTLHAGEKAGKNFETTLRKLESEECTSMDEILQCVNWLVSTSCNEIKGRNFSVKNDPWKEKKLEEALKSNPNMFKLRRSHNSYFEANTQ